MEKERRKKSVMKKHKYLRRQLRRWKTPAESVLWNALRAKRFRNKKFRRQHSMGPYIVDFYCAVDNLVVEVDGAVHHDIGSQYYDEERDNWLREQGCTILRFTNTEVFEQVERILLTIEQYLKPTDK